MSDFGKIIGIGAALFFLSMLISVVFTALAKAWATRLGLMDMPGHRKVHVSATPRNGGIGIFWGIALPILAGTALLAFIMKGAAGIRPEMGTIHDFQMLGVHVNDSVARYLPGMIHHRPLVLLLLATTFLIHLLGLMDDRKAMAPVPKLLGQLAIAALLVFGGEIIEPGGFRVLTLFGPFPSGGFFLSVLISILWIVALTNAFNFLDNMDGLAAGVAIICALMFLIAAIHGGQWFICGLLVLFMGSVAGFLLYNFPPASIFMGDGGSMVLGFFLSALTIRTTYYTGSGNQYAVLIPLIVLAVPLYDLLIVSALRLARGKSPLVGDTNHFSHRLTRHGFSKRGAVLIIYGVTLASGFSAPLLARSNDPIATALIVAQCGAILVIIGVLERVGEHTN